MPFITVGAHPVHLMASGDGDAPALILLHGSGGNLRSWPRALRSLPGLHVVAVDLPGHGGSGGEPIPTVSALAGWVEELVSTLGLVDVTLCGHSLGGAVALTVALTASARGPSWLRGQILVGTGARLRVAPGILATVEREFGAAVELIGRFLFGPEVSSGVVEAASAAIRDAGPAVLLADFRACDAFDVLDRLGEVRTPTLVVAATEDRLTPLKYGRFLASAIPGAQLAVIEGAGHMMALEQPDELARAIAAFVREGRDERPR